MKFIKISTLFSVLLTWSLQQSIAQNIDCDHIYWMNNDEIVDFNPATKTYKPYYIACPDGSSGLAIAPDFKKKDKLTFYTTVSSQLHYYDGTKWVNTNHNVESVNIAGGGNYMYILDGINAMVYRYDGKSDATLLLDLETFGGPFDIVCDKKGNFYLMHTKLNKLIHYDPNGKILNEYTLTGLNNQSSGGGFAYRDNVVYANVSGGSVIGKFVNGVIEFKPCEEMPTSMNDFASCPLDVFVPQNVVVKDTLPQDAEYTDGNIPLTVKDRKVELQNTITVTNPEFQIQIYDK